MKRLYLRKKFWFMLFSLLSLISVSQTDSTSNYNFITQQMDAYYDSIISVGGDSALEGTGFKEYSRWKNHSYFTQGKNGDLGAHEEFIANYFEGTRNISEDGGETWYCLTDNNYKIRGVNSIVVNP